MVSASTELRVDLEVVWIHRAPADMHGAAWGWYVHFDPQWPTVRPRDIDRQRLRKGGWYA
jgi:hypothetical protein